MYMDYINFLAKNEKELLTLIQTERIYSQDIGMEFGMLVMKSSKRHIMEGVELPNQVRIGKKESYKYLWILEADIIEQVEMEKN